MPSPEHDTEDISFAQRDQNFYALVLKKNMLAKLSHRLSHT